MQKKTIKNHINLTYIIIIILLFFATLTLTRNHEIKNKLENTKNNFEQLNNFILGDLNIHKNEILNNNSNLDFEIKNDIEVDSDSFSLINRDNELIFIFNDKDNNRQYYKTFKSYEYLFEKEVLNYFVIGKNASVYYEYVNIESNNLSFYLNSSDKLDQALNERSKSYLDKDKLVSIYNISDNYYFVEVIIANKVITRFHLYLIIYTLIYFSIINFIYFSVKYFNKYKLSRLTKFDNLIFKDLKYVYMFETTKGGKITYINENLRPLLNIKPNNIKELLSDKTNLNASDEILIRLTDGEYSFKVHSLENRIVYTYKLYIDEINRRDMLINYNSVSNYKNKNFFSKYLNNLDSKQSLDFFIFDIKNFKKISLNTNHDTSLNIIKDWTEYFNEKFSEHLIELFHIELDVLVLVLKENRTDKEIKDVIDQFKRYISNKYKIEPNFSVGYLNSQEVNNADILDLLNTVLKKSKELNSIDIIRYNNDFVKKLKEEEDFERVLINAVSQDLFEVYFQPIVSLKNNKVIAFEALLRLNKDKYKFISPERFIELAEKSNLIYEITTLTIKKTVEFIERANSDKIQVSFNVSPVQIMEQGFVNKLINEISKAKVNYNQVVVEITENVFIESLQLVNNKLKSLRNLGVKVYLDDFGTGYSSFKYLNDLELDAIKIDREFISVMVQDKRVESIVKVITDLAHKLDLNVISEGVETSEQVKMLKKMNCDYIQGFIISRALNIEDALKFVNQVIKF